MSFMGNDKKGAGSTARAKAAADRRARVEREMAKEAAMIEAMERKLRGGAVGGIATANEELRDEMPEANPNEVEEEDWSPRGEHDDVVEGEEEEDVEVDEVGEDGNLSFLKGFDYSAEATRIAAMEEQLRQMRNGGREAIESGGKEEDGEEEVSEGGSTDNEEVNNEADDGGYGNDVDENPGELPFDLSTYLTGQSQPPRGSTQRQHGSNRYGDEEEDDLRDAAQARSLQSLRGGSPSADMLHASSNTPPLGDNGDGTGQNGSPMSGGRRQTHTTSAAAVSPDQRDEPSPRSMKKEEDDDEVDDEKREERAALSIQTAARGRVGRQRVAIRRRRHDEKAAQNAAAIRIQNAERTRRSSVQVRHMRQQQKRQQPQRKEHGLKHNRHSGENGFGRGERGSQEDRGAPSPPSRLVASAVVVPLLQLSASDVTEWLNASGLSAVATALAANGIDGATLSDPDLSEGDFQELGVSLRLHRARLLNLVRSAQTNGVVCTWKSSQSESHSPSRQHHRQNHDRKNQLQRRSTSTLPQYNHQSAACEEKDDDVLTGPVNTSREFPDDFEDVGTPANQLRLLSAFD